MSRLTLKPQDVVVLLKCLLVGQARPSIAQMGLDIGISASEVHAGLRRLRAAGRLGPSGDVHVSATEEFSSTPSSTRSRRSAGNCGAAWSPRSPRRP
jgi:hypothetical protein